MAHRPLPSEAQFLADIILPVYDKLAMERLLSGSSYNPRSRFLSPCEEEGCEHCTGIGCDCEHHLTRAEDEHDAEAFADKMFPQGCQCPNNGDGDCDWCQAKQDWMINDPSWRNDALEGL